MTQEEKQLLLKDLCARLPYNVVIRCTDNDTDYKCFLTTDILNELLHNTEYYDYKPYLRPMSSITEEEAEKYNDLINELSDYYDCQPEQLANKMIDWLNEHHFDFRGLIPMELALEAPEGLYNKN